MTNYVLGLLSLVISGNMAFGSIKAPDLLVHYHHIRTALAGDAFTEVQNLAGQSISSFHEWLKEAGLEAPERPEVLRMLEGASKLALTGQESEQRRAFSTLSDGTVGLLRKTPSLQPDLQLFFCPMVTTFAYWVQPKGEKIANPYMGLKMLTCGSKKPW